MLPVQYFFIFYNGSISELAKEGILAGKRTSKFQEQIKPLNQYTLMENLLRHFLYQKVQQLTLKSKPIKTLNSITEAAKAMNQASCSNISSVCKGKSH